MMELRGRFHACWQEAPFLFRVGDRPLPHPLPTPLAYLEEGDIVYVVPETGSIRVIYRRSSRFNSLLLTEACNSYCVMCSQPPRRDDGEGLRIALGAIPLMSTETAELGLTGGEPTLLGDGFLDVLRVARDHLPETALHVLTNGRLFTYLSFAQDVAQARHPDLVFGIPLYGDTADVHDYVVQSRGAFDQTARGLLNAARLGLRLEVRVVLQSETIPRLPALARFIARNFPFVEHVALMGLELMGFARANLDSIWIDPADYRAELEAAVRALDDARIRVSIYNLPLCVLDRALWPFARQSISDWKNEYLPVCEPCRVRGRCAGFFASAGLRLSRGLRAITEDGDLEPLCR